MSKKDQSMQPDSVLLLPTRANCIPRLSSIDGSNPHDNQRRDDTRNGLGSHYHHRPRHAAFEDTDHTAYLDGSGHRSILPNPIDEEKDVFAPTPLKIDSLDEKLLKRKRVAESQKYVSNFIWRWFLGTIVVVFASCDMINASM